MLLVVLLAVMVVIAAGPAGLRLVARWMVSRGRFRDPSRVERLASLVLGGAPPAGFRGSAGIRLPGLLLLALYAPAPRPFAADDAAPSPMPPLPASAASPVDPGILGRVGLFLLHVSRRLSLTREEMEEQVRRTLLESQSTGESVGRALGWIVVRIRGQRVVLSEKEAVAADGARLRQFSGTFDSGDGPALVMLMGDAREFDRAYVEDLFSGEPAPA